MLEVEVLCEDHVIGVSLDELLDEAIRAVTKSLACGVFEPCVFDPGLMRETYVVVCGLLGDVRGRILIEADTLAVNELTGNTSLFVGIEGYGIRFADFAHRLALEILQRLKHLVFSASQARLTSPAVLCGINLSASSYCDSSCLRSYGGKHGLLRLDIGLEGCHPWV